MSEGCYLLTGDDSWSKNQYINKIKLEVLGSTSDMMNLIELYDKEVTPDKVIEAVETLPFFKEQKLIILHETGLLKKGKKEDSERFESIVNNLPQYAIIIINDKEVDKRSKLYKLLKKNDTVVEFEFPSELDLCALLLNNTSNSEISISKSTMIYFIQKMPQDINYILGEWDKLISYVDGNEITQKAVDEICVFSLEIRVFELVKKIVEGKSTEALSIYHRMLQSKESPIGILVLVARQYRMIYKVKYLVVNGKSQRDIAAGLKLPGFVVKEMIDKSNNYSFVEIEKVLERCMIADENIKKGKLGQNEAVELLIMQCIVKKG